MPDGTDKLISFASRSLAPADKNFSQLDKKGLAGVFAVRLVSVWKAVFHLHRSQKHNPKQILWCHGVTTFAMDIIVVRL